MIDCVYWNDSALIRSSPLQSMEDVYLNYVCYAILFFSFTFSLASLPTDYGISAAASANRFVQADGVWQLVVVIFLVYTMLPMKTHVAFFMGASLPVAHLAVSAALVHNERVGLRWQQVRNRTGLAFLGSASVQPVTYVQFTLLSKSMNKLCDFRT